MGMALCCTATSTVDKAKFGAIERWTTHVDFGLRPRGVVVDDRACPGHYHWKTPALEVNDDAWLNKDGVIASLA